jgi:multicomponent Na+:H+ antiporter subunit B
VISPTSPIVALAVRAITPLALVVAAFVLFTGHNQPGGGFAAGLMLGAIIVLRTIAGISRPGAAPVWLAVGGAVVGAVAIAPLLWGEPLLDQVVVSWDVPVLGTVKTGSALAFDLGVVAVVVGLVIALLDGLDASSLVDRGRPGGDAVDRTDREVSGS